MTQNIIQSLQLGSDIGIRNEWFLAESMAHPAKLHLGLLQWVIDRYTKPGDTLADPMAGIGSILYAATQQRNVIAREIEPKWLEICHKNAAYIIRLSGLLAGTIEVGQADARSPWNFKADHLIFSPPYGCRASSNKSQRHYVSHKVYKMAKEQGISYTDRWKQFVDKPSIGAAGAMTFFYGDHPEQIGHFQGNRYWQAMTDIYSNAYQALGCGYMVLILKDHIRENKRVETANQTLELCQELGFKFVEQNYRKVHPLSLWQRRRKERGEAIVEEEAILVFSK